MELPIVRRIRENVHGTIDITALEDRIISHPYVQRMRRIKQLAFLQFVFPGASHSRFEHSLGVMHLAGVAWNKLHANQLRIAQSATRYGDFAAVEKEGYLDQVHGLLAPTFPALEKIFGSAYTLQALRLGALLHDLGHAPFSHSGELFMPSWQAVIDQNQDQPAYLVNYLKHKAERLTASGRDPSTVPVRHEIFTLLLIQKLLTEVYQQRSFKGEKIEAQDVASVIAPEISPVAGSPLHEFGAHRLCNELVSGEFDIDRMDYLLRDSRECGVVYGIFDESRIVNSLAIYFNPVDKGVHLAIQLSGLAAFEDYLRARHSMYLQVYFHKTSVAAEAMLKHMSRKLGDWRLPCRPEDYAKIDEHNVGAILLEAARTTIDSPEERLRFQTSLEDLLYNRRLWKRVYEISSGGEHARHISAGVVMEKAKQIIHKMGYEFEQISSTSSLTRFRPRAADEPSRNYLRLIKKDERQFPRVTPIEDDFSVVTANPSVNISRLYVEGGETESGEPIEQAVRKQIVLGLSQ